MRAKWERTNDRLMAAAVLFACGGAAFLVAMATVSVLVGHLYEPLVYPLFGCLIGAESMLCVAVAHLFFSTLGE